jgi:hypothetical protein
MGNKRRTKRTIIVIVICLAVAALAITVFHKPSIAQYEDDFGFSLEKISVKTLDHYHHDDFRDSLTIYRVSVTGDIEGSIFDRNKMADGLSESAKVLLGEAAELTEGKQGFEDLRTMGLHGLRSMELEAVNNTDAQLYIIYYGEDNDYLVIWNG